MLRRAMLRVRRRIPGRSASYQSPDRRESEALATSDDVYYCSIEGKDDNGHVVQKQRLQQALEYGLENQLNHGKHTHGSAAMQWLKQMHQEDRATHAAWTRLQHWYTVFQTLEQVASQWQEDGLVASKDQGLRTLLDQVQGSPGVILRDLHAVAKQMKNADMNPEGFTSEMFYALGNALYSAASTPHDDECGIKSDAFACVGDLLYAQAVSVSA